MEAVRNCHVGCGFVGGWKVITHWMFVGNKGIESLHGPYMILYGVFLYSQLTPSKMRSMCCVVITNSSSSLRAIIVSSCGTILYGEGLKGRLAVRSTFSICFLFCITCMILFAFMKSTAQRRRLQASSLRKRRGQEDL